MHLLEYILHKHWVEKIAAIVSGLRRYRKTADKTAASDFTVGRRPYAC